MDIDVELQAVAQRLVALDEFGERWAWLLRSTYDQLYDGQRTGRYSWAQLMKTEKTHFGTLVEINAQREFRFPDGEVLDYRIEDVEVDCKFSHTGQWMIPPEAHGHLCLVVTASDPESTFQVGLIRVTDDHLSVGRNRDAKATLNAVGRAAIRWIYRPGALPPNLLLHLAAVDVAEIFQPSSGQQRVNRLFRIAQHYLVTRNVVATVARQDDFMKRVRENGGARSALRPEGIIILGGDYKRHQDIAVALDLPVPPPGCFVSARVAPAETGETEGAEIAGGIWRLAWEGDPVVPAPRLPGPSG